MERLYSIQHAVVSEIHTCIMEKLQDSMKAILQANTVMRSRRPSYITLIQQTMAATLNYWFMGYTRGDFTSTQMLSQDSYRW